MGQEADKMIFDYIRRFAGRTRALREDDQGNVLLPSAMMGFLLGIMGLFALNTSEAVYNRIMAQNAADAAAETAALWQARGLNLLQLLNNAHYQANVAVYVAEWYALGRCATVPVKVIDEWSCCVDPFCWGGCPGLISDVNSACRDCSRAGPLNELQNTVAQGILGAQSLVTKLFPALAFVYANQLAKEAGGDPLNQALPQYLEKIGAQLRQTLGIPFPSSLGEGALGGLAQWLSYVPEFYAFPLRPGALALHAREVDGEHWPWKWNQFPLPEQAWKIGAAGAWNLAKLFCQGDPLQFGRFLSAFDDHTWPSQWGWSDQYYRGHPGFMTWIAGKTNRAELAGLGALRWLNGSAPPESEPFTSLYAGEQIERSQKAWLRIPPVIALASSQVEGTGVVAKDTGDFFGSMNVFNLPPVDSRPSLIRVHIMLNEPSYLRGTDLLIFH